MKHAGKPSVPGSARRRLAAVCSAGCAVLLLCASPFFGARTAAGGTARRPSGGRESVESFGGRYGFPAPTRSDRLITLRSRYTTITFETNSRKMSYNGLLVWLNAPVVLDGRRWSLASADIDKVIDPLLRADRALAGAGFTRIVLDPGHGGDDVGAIGTRRTYEKNVALDIARLVGERLRGTGLNVMFTRETDSGLGLGERVAKAARWNADLFVSIHCNAAADSAAQGVETYVMPAAGFPSTAGNRNARFFPGNAHDRANMLLAHYVHRELLAKTGAADRGIRRARFDVLRGAPCPAILVECGFLSNRIEEEKLLTREYRERVAAGIAEGIVQYVNRARVASALGAGAR